MTEDDDTPKKPQTHLVGAVLDDLSIDEIGARIVLLEAEIVRLKAAIEAKTASRSAAEAAFKF